MKKTTVQKPSLFLFLQITQTLNKKKKSEHPLVDIRNVCKVSVKNIELYGSWSSSKLSIFQAKIQVSGYQ